MIHPVPDHRVILRHRVLHQGGPASLQGQQAHHVAHFNSLLHKGSHQARGGDRHIHTPRLVKKPLVAGVIHARHGARHPVLAAAQERNHQVCLVVTGGGHHHFALFGYGQLQHRQLTGIPNKPLHLRQVGAFFRLRL